MKMQMIGLLFLWKIPETACVLSYLIEKSQFDNYKLLSAAANATFEPIKKHQEAQSWTFFENSIYKMYALTNYLTASWELKSDLVKKQFPKWALLT